MIFSIAMGADYSFEVKNIEIWVPAFFKNNNSSVATVLKLYATRVSDSPVIHTLCLFDSAVACKD